MNLDESQRQQVRGWIEQGLQPAEIQKRLADEFGVRLTYMEVRFLLDDLQVQIKDKEPAPTPTLPVGQSVGADRSKGSSPGETTEGAEGEAWNHGVSVTVDQVMRAGALVSGKVTFSDGKKADWHLDQMGRLGLAPQEPGYRPTQQDLHGFQAELQSVLGRMGY